MPYPQDHFLGRSGQRAVMAEFLKRGYNVAVPEVDTGDEFPLMDDRSGTFSRVQVKSSSTKPLKLEPGYQAQFWIPTRQLYTPKRPDLYYVLAARPPEGRAGWTLRLLSDRMVGLGHVESVSHETVRQTLKKTNSSRG